MVNEKTHSELMSKQNCKTVKDNAVKHFWSFLSLELVIRKLATVASSIGYTLRDLSVQLGWRQNRWPRVRCCKWSFAVDPWRNGGFAWQANSCHSSLGSATASDFWIFVIWFLTCGQNQPQVSSEMFWIGYIFLLTFSELPTYSL